MTNPLSPDEAGLAAYLILMRLLGFLEAKGAISRDDMAAIFGEAANEAEKKRTSKGHTVARFIRQGLLPGATDID